MGLARKFFYRFQFSAMNRAMSSGLRRRRSACTVCKSSRLGAVDAMLARGVPFGKIATAVGIHKSSIGRHSLNCTARRAVNDAERDEQRRRLTQRIADELERADADLEKARADGDEARVLFFSREVRRLLALSTKASG